MGGEPISLSEITPVISDYIEKTFLVSFGDGLTLRSNLFDEGIIDSYGLVEIVGFIESKFGVSFGDDDLLSPLLASAEGMAQIVHDIILSRQGGEKASDLQEVRPSQ